jgi:protein ImuB
MFICLVRDSLSPSRPGVLATVARACSPRVETHGDDVVLCDGRGLTRVIGMPAVIAEEMRRMAWDREVGVRVAIAGSRTAAWLLAHVRSGTTIVSDGRERAQLERLSLPALRTLPSSLLTHRPSPAKRGNRVDSQKLDEVLATLDRWGLVTLGDFARLPRAEVLTRLGALGGRLHQAACGEDATPLVPSVEAPRFVERLELEWPVEGLEPLSFVLARMCDGLSAALAAADRGAVSLTTRLRLVTKATHVRVLTMPAPMRDAKTLRTLILLDLEANPAPAGIDIVEVECGVTPGRIVQGSLLTYPVPTPENLSTLIARLQALVGEDRVGAPVVVDSHDARAMAMQAFAPSTSEPQNPRTFEPQNPGTAPGTLNPEPRTSLRRRRPPTPVRVRLEKATPVEVAMDSMSSFAAVTSVAGPWRTSGQWWTNDAGSWDRDEWDVALDTGVTYRLARHRHSNQWDVEGEVD